MTDPLDTPPVPRQIKAHLLLVDDEPLVLKMLQTFLISQDYQVTCASGGHAALEIIEQQHQQIDLLITDIRMPDMNGIRLLEAVRQLNPTLPVLLMTGYSDFDLVVEGLKQQAFDLLLKPIDFEQLNWCIAKALAFVTARRLEQQYRVRLEEQVAQQTRLLCDQLEALQEAQRKAGEVQELKREFLNLISHELRTPLNGIVGAVQLMESDGQDSRHAEFIEILKTSSQRMTTLVNNLLTLVEARAHKGPQDNGINSPCTALAELESRFRSQAAAAGVNFSAECSDLPNLTLYGPWDALQIIAGCLLDNAIKFSGRGGTVQCRIWAERNSNDPGIMEVLLQVKDNGRGIPHSHQELIFQPFTQVEHYLTRRVGGSGIGLAIVRTLCDKLGGSLKLASSPESGSCFTCGLPFSLIPREVATR